MNVALLLSNCGKVARAQARAAMMEEAEFSEAERRHMNRVCSTSSYISSVEPLRVRMAGRILLRKGPGRHQ